MPEGHPLRPGDPERLGAYRLAGRLGEGSQGVVYLGRDPSGAPVAIKLLHARMADHPRARERFVQELSAAKKVARFCTAQVLDADLAGDRPYIVSEYVEGRSLRSQILDEGPRAGGALERLATSTLTALAAIHKAGVIHRDFTPHNVLLGPDGPRVIDFGIARALDGVRHNESNSVGTPAYMAPEQVTGDEIGPPADMFAWGGTILFAATGRPPFGNESVRAVMDRVLRAEADVMPLPEPLRSVVARCLSKDPAERPTAQQAHAALLGQEPLGPLDPPPAFGVPAGAPDPVEPKGPAIPAWPGPAEHRPHGAAGADGTGPGGAGPRSAPMTSAVPGPAPRLAGVLPVRWAVAAGAAATLLVTAVALTVWPGGGDAATSPRVSAVAAPPAPASPSPTPSPDIGRAKGVIRRVAPTPKKKHKKRPPPGCRDYDRTYAVADAGRIRLTATVCRGVFSGTVVLTDTVPKDAWQVCAQLRGHVAGTTDVFISTPAMASKAGTTQAFDNGPDLRFGAKTHKREDWVQLNAGRCRASGGGLRTSWVTHDHLAAG